MSVAGPERRGADLQFLGVALDRCESLTFAEDAPDVGKWTRAFLVAAGTGVR